jgi:hypothetical protein
MDSSLELIWLTLLLASIIVILVLSQILSTLRGIRLQLGELDAAAIAAPIVDELEKVTNGCSDVEMAVKEVEEHLEYMTHLGEMKSDPDFRNDKRVWRKR